MAYPSIASINMSQGISEVLKFTNTVTNNWMSNMLLIAIFMITFMGFSRTNSDYFGGFAVAGFITAVMGTLLWVIGFINGTTYGIVLAVMFVGLVVILVHNKS
jgi:hypothetical protein